MCVFNVASHLNSRICGNGCVSPVRGVSASVNQRAQLGSDTRWLTAGLQWKQGSSVCKEEENQRISRRWTTQRVRARVCVPILCLWLVSPAGWKKLSGTDQCRTDWWIRGNWLHHWIPHLSTFQTGFLCLRLYLMKEAGGRASPGHIA